MHKTDSPVPGEPESRDAGPDGKPAHGHDLSDEDVNAFFEPGGWDERYSAEEQVWSGNPNAQLVAEASGLAPGTALDVGCGEGGDVVWLARNGWRVTGADFSSTGLARAARHAEQAGVADRVDWWQVDARDFTAEGRSYDLVTTHFLHPPEGGMLDVVTYSLDVECLPTAIPEAINVDVTNLAIGHSIHVSELVLPAGIKVLNDPETPIVSIHGKAKEEAPAAE